MSTNEPASATVHASAVLTGAHAMLIRGPSAAGKSRLVLTLLQAAQCGLLPFARLVGDDRVHLEARHGRLLVRPADALAGLIEVRGVGIQRFSYEPVAVVGLVVDLSSTSAERLPVAEDSIEIEGIRLPRLAVASRAEPSELVMARLRSTQLPTQKSNQAALP